MADEAIRELLAKKEIHEALLRYCRGVDRGDTALIRSAYWEDVTENHGAYQGDRLDDFLAYAMERSAVFSTVSHYVTNHLIELDGDRAYSEAYALAVHTGERGGRPFQAVFGGRYVDRFEKRDGAWKIAHRVVVHDWSTQGEIEHWERGMLFVQGVPSRADIAYERA
ncbi:nuclear transport factor 2 family protein [Amycolatopsis pithecellobii]|uniref:Nuclear transport factor 2 family protein n=1 Tax=Amycolatopsis pithecellobii TaxID=664692 RepID=A0A6N7Z0U2_9PSEU|nr:nuclear transport factor 2 family protein [Amycolatopsis pithecellobii]MTD54963.1 nuclear transport factor 2 family protein [Amycolatopsis pithecellobii]